MKTSFFSPLETMDREGNIPATRISDPHAAQELVDLLIQGNSERNRTDAVVYGLFSGNPPYRSSELRKNAQSWRSNVNWRIAEAFLQSALTNYWDVIASCPTFCTVNTLAGKTLDEREEWNGIMTEEFDKLNHADTDLNYMFQLSQHDMVLFRMGPVMWFDPLDYRARPVPQQYLYVPDNTKSNLSDWPFAVIRVSTPVHELYGKIANAKAATAAGWNVEEARLAITEAAPDSVWPNNLRYDWLWYEQKLRQNDLYYSSVSEAIPIAYVLWREFAKDGMEKISMCAIVEGTGRPNFLYRKENKYENWKQALVPFYYDTGDGFHHSVKGLGIKSYGALETYNRLQCHLVDAAFFGSSLHFQAQNGADLQNLSVIPMGPYIWHPPGGTYLPTVQLGTALDGPMGIKQDLLSTLTNNLAQYRQQLQRKTGNPVTAREIEYESENVSTIARSQMNRYFEQLDDFWSERFRRAANSKLTASSSGGKECLEFQKRCLNRGVPAEAMKRIESVRATRTVGYGSPDARNQIMNRLLGMIPLLGETGRQHVLEDVVGNQVGVSLMRRYIPEMNTLPEGEMEQAAEARQEVAGMRVGVTPLVTPKQNSMIYAQTFMKALADALQSVQQGGNPGEVVKFAQAATPAIAAHLQKMGNDPTRANAAKQMMDQFKQMTQAVGQLQAQMQRMMQQQQQQAMQQRQQQMAAGDNMQINRAKAANDMQLKQAKQNQAMALKEAQTRQKMRLADVSTAQKLKLQQAQAAASTTPE